MVQTECLEILLLENLIFRSFLYRLMNSSPTRVLRVCPVSTPQIPSQIPVLTPLFLSFRLLSRVFFWFASFSRLRSISTFYSSRISSLSLLFSFSFTSRPFPPALASHTLICTHLKLSSYSRQSWRLSSPNRPISLSLG